MTDFVFDGTTLPDGKSDYQPNTYPVNKSYTAAEWNTVMAAIADLRNAVISGKYHGLANDVSAAIAGASGVRLRNNAGKLQASENAGIYRKVTGDEIHASDYGAVADGVTDDSAALQAAITAAGSLKRPLRLAKGIYQVNTPLVMTAQCVILGSPTDFGSGGTVLRAGASMGHVMVIDGASWSHIYGIEFHANRLATYGLRLDSGGFIVFEKCLFQSALRDGVHLPRLKLDGVTFTLADSNHWLNCDGYRNGQLYATTTLAAAYAGLNVPTTAAVGTIATTSGGFTITGTGTAFLSMGLRAGDFIRVGTGVSPQVRMIESVDSNTQLTLGDRQALTTTLSGQEFMIGAGCGYREEFAPDTNLNRITGGLWRSNAACGIHLAGLYGALVEGVQLDTCPFYGIAVNRSGGGGQTYNTLIMHPYTEGCEAGSFFLGSAYGITILEPFMDPAKPGIVITAGSGLNLGGGVVAAIGGATSTIPSTSGLNFYNLGKFRVGTYYALTGTSAAQIDPTGGVFGLVSPTDGVAVTLSATPIINGGVDGQILILYNQSLYNVTLESEAARAGSKLYLASNKLVLAPGESVTLIYYDNVVGWKEIARGVGAFKDLSGTPGAATQNTTSGCVSIAAGAASVVVTNNRITTKSVIHATLQSSDVTLTQILRVVPAGGSFTIIGNANATANTQVCWSLVS